MACIALLRRCRMSFTLLACLLATAGCGGGSADEGADTRSARAADARKGAPTLSLDTSGDALQPDPRFAASQLLTHLAVAGSDAGAAPRGLARTELCREGFATPAELVKTEAVALPASGGVFFSATERALWRDRVKAGPFVHDGDFSPSSPGDWARVQANMRRFLADGEALRSDDDSTRSMHGQLARDAAFVQLLQPDAALLAAVRRWLLEQVSTSSNDFASQRCYTAADGTSRDGYFAEGPWLARFAASYDFVRADLPAADRVVIENYLRRNAWFFATQLDWGLRNIFPRRLAGDYGQRTESAAASGDERWWMRRVDSNGDCSIDDRDDARSYPVYTHVRADGALGNQVPVLAMWFNNRRAANALAVGAAGLLLADNGLVERAKRYTMEWLTYGVFADGSSAEYMRGGEYCVARQGLIYGNLSVQSGVVLARLLARQGDRTLLRFATHEGRFGTESAAEPKTLALTADTLLRASSGELGWHQAEPQKLQQQPRAATALGSPRIRYLGTEAMDSLHELGLLSHASALPTLDVAGRLLQHPLITRPAGSAAGVPVVSGLGSWTDAFGLLPAAYLLRPCGSACSAATTR